MIKRLAILAVALACATGIVAQGYTPRTVPNVQLSDARRFTSNPNGILSAGTVAEIDRMCADLRQRGLAEVVVLVLDRVDEGSLDMFAHNVLNLWGVGQKGRDNGLVISVVRQQRDIQFETGYGLEGVLPDAICKRIQTVYMIGPLGAGDLDKGVIDGVKAVYNVLTDNQAELGALNATDGSEVPSGILGVMALVLLVFVALLIAIAARHNKKGGDGDGLGGSPTDGSGTGSFGRPDAGAIIGGILGGGFGRGGFGGGGFGGGGFGGGRSGGGGARSGF